jgi:hypothetical protein
LAGYHKQGARDAGVDVELVHCLWRRGDVM